MQGQEQRHDVSPQGEFEDEDQHPCHLHCTYTT